MHSTALDLALSELETLPSRETIRERVTDLERRAIRHHATDVQRFLRYIVRPCLAGVDSSALAPEFDLYGRRFRELWRRVR